MFTWAVGWVLGPPGGTAYIENAFLFTWLLLGCCCCCCCWLWWGWATPIIDAAAAADGLPPAGGVGLLDGEAPEVTDMRGHAEDPCA